MRAMSTDPLIRDLVEMLRLTRDIERDVFGAIPPDLRERPLRPGDWSPKDHQAHLSAWKERQADRLAAVRRGEVTSYSTDAETDAINAELQRRSADATWQEVVSQADETSARLAAELEATDPEVVRSSAHELIGSTFGNSGYHVAQHVRWLKEAGIPVDSARLRRFVSDLAELARHSSLPDRDRSVALYNAACYAAIDGDLATSRGLLPEAFSLNAELVAVARTDPDLVELRDELPAEGQ
jgi:DinB superfamily